MDEMIHKLSGPQIVGFVAIVVGSACCLIVALAGIIVPYWKLARQAEAEVMLKRDLVSAGFSADEIERVVRATSNSARQRERNVARVG